MVRLHPKMLAGERGRAMKPPILLYDPPRRARTDYRIGLSAWTDKSMLEEGQFYPRKTMSAEERLRWYSRHFDVVEVNSSFYAIPSPDMTSQWVTRTPPEFLFNVKAYGLLTGHHADAARLPDELRALLPASIRKKRTGRIPNGQFTAEARLWTLRELRTALGPLRKANKLGYLLFQLAPWITYSEAALDGLASLPKALPETTIAVEFRHRSWFGTRTDEMLSFLRDHGLAYVTIDGPRTRAAVLSLPPLTTETAVFRLHGRNFAGFLQGKSPTVAEEYDSLYELSELEEISKTAGALNGKAERVHVAMNNNRGDYPAINGMQLKQMLLEDWRPPDREALIEELEERRAKQRGTKRRPRRAA